MEHFSATVDAVGSVVACVGIGALVAPWIPNMRVTSRDLSYIVTAFGVPALMFSHMANSFTPSMISTQTAVLFGFALLGCAIGAGAGWLSGHLLFGRRCPHMTNLLWFGCAFQNTVIFPLGLLGSLSVSWLTVDVMAACVAYIFVYSVLLSLIMWTVGQEYVRVMGVRLHHGIAASEEGATQHSRLYKAMRFGSAALFTGSFVSIVLGMICGLIEVPKTAPASLAYVYKILYDASDTLGSLPVPGSLLLLGVSLRNTAATVETTSVTVKATTDDASAPAAVAPVTTTRRDVTLLSLGMIVTRLVAVPSIVLAVFHIVLRPIFPDLAQDPAFMMVLIVESSAPTAIACLLVFTTHDYYPAPFAKAVFAEYLAVIVSSAVWLTIALWYVEASGAV